MRMQKNCGGFYNDFVLELRNEEKKGFIKQHEITPEEHLEFMSKYQEEYSICLDNGTPVGWIGIVKNDIRLAVSGEHQGKGIGAFMLNDLVKKNALILDELNVIIKTENVGSFKLFKKCGFKVVSQENLLNGEEKIPCYFMKYGE